MNLLKWMFPCGVAMLLGACRAALAQPKAPAPQMKDPIMGIKLTEPLTVLESTFTAAPADAGQVMTPIAEGIFAAAAEARINILPNCAIVVILTPMEEMIQGPPDEMAWAIRVPIIDDVEPGELPGHPDVKVVRVEPRLVGYTYAKGPPEIVVEPRITALVLWVMEQGYTPLGPTFMLFSQDTQRTDPDDIVSEVQVGIKEPEEAGEAGEGQ